MKKSKVLLILAAIVFCLIFAACGQTDKKLLAPQNLQVTDMTLTWDEVKNAVGYAVFFESKEYQVTENSFDIPSVSTGTYQVEVMALGGIRYDDSDWTIFSFDVRLSKLPTPKNLKEKDRTLAWDKVEDAVGYTVFF